MILKLIVQHCILIPIHINSPTHTLYYSKDATPFNSTDIYCFCFLQLCKNGGKKLINLIEFSENHHGRMEQQQQ